MADKIDEYIDKAFNLLSEYCKEEGVPFDLKSDNRWNEVGMIDFASWILEKLDKEKKAS